MTRIAITIWEYTSKVSFTRSFALSRWRFIRAITSHTLRTYVTFTASSIQRISYSYRYHRARAFAVAARIFIAGIHRVPIYQRTQPPLFFPRAIFIDARRIMSAAQRRLLDSTSKLILSS